MMIGDRIRQARLASGLTLEDVVQRMKRLGEPITRQGLSNYENNKRGPGPSMLMKLSRALNVKPAHFMTKTDVSIAWGPYRRLPELSNRDQERIKAVAQTVCERQITLQTTLVPQENPVFPKPARVRTHKDAEVAAVELRTHWALGEAAIESLTQTIENNGGVIVDFPNQDITFDGLAGWVNERFPLIVVNSNVPHDRIRFSLAHELGHLVMDCPQKENEEDLAMRFAEAFLVPASVARRELGKKRRSIMFEELAVLKCKYGFSMQGWLYRAWHLEIISENYFKTMRAEFNKRGWRTREPVPYEGDETPTRLRQMTLRALSEGIITPEKAEELCPGCAKEADALEQQKGPRPFSSPSELLKLPRSKRRAILAKAAELAEKEYRENRELTAFEAFGEEEVDE